MAAGRAGSGNQSQSAPAGDSVGASGGFGMSSEQVFERLYAAAGLRIDTSESGVGQVVDVATGRLAYVERPLAAVLPETKSRR